MNSGKLRKDNPELRLYFNKRRELMKEIKIHHQYPCYGFTANGKVYSFKRNMWLSTKITPNGYVQATLRAYNKTVYVHRMVAELFCTAGTGNTVNHKDGNKLNNHYKNLEWVTMKENIAHARKTGLRKDCPKGDKCWNTRITSEQHLQIQQLRDDGKTHRAIGKIVGCSRSLIGLILSGAVGNTLKCNDQSKGT